MFELFPRAPFIPFGGQHEVPACEWVLPAGAPIRNYFTVCKCLPPGTPDCLQLSIEHSEDGSGRCVAAIYGDRAYLIHYEFRRR